MVDVKIVVCPGKQISGQILNFIVEFYDKIATGGIRAMNGWHEYPSIKWSHRPFKTEYIDMKNIEKFISIYENKKDFIIERW